MQATWELDNPHGTQPLQFILHISGDADVSDVTLAIDGAGEILMPITLQAGSILKYVGRGQGILYDKSWNELEKVQLDYESSLLRYSDSISQSSTSSSTSNI